MARVWPKAVSKPIDPKYDDFCEPKTIDEVAEILNVIHIDTS